jgi:APA family basic amino acid/polyamine antiporter
VKGTKLGFSSGVGLVVASMVGVGVLTTAGFMARDLGPGTILWAWVVGAVAAASGARAYATLAELVPRSGGEYRYLSTLLHPAAGYLAGWTSLLVGFSAPVALSAYTAGAFAATLVPGLQPRAVGAALVIVVTLVNALDVGTSRRAQDALVVVKVLLLVGFVALGAMAGAHGWPTWTAPGAGAGRSLLGPFMVSQIYIAYAFTGWNTVAYMAEEFRDPRRDVPRSMVIGALVVGAMYLAVNWVFVANLGRERLVAWTHGDTERITLAHLIAEDLLGRTGGRVMSAVVFVALTSSVSAMTVAGPHVYAAMAGEGYLPRFLIGPTGQPSRAPVWVQGAIAILLIATHSFELLLRNVGAILTFNSALTALSLWRVQLDARHTTKPGPLALAAATIYIGLSAWMLYFAVADSPVTVVWLVAVMGIALAAYVGTRLLARR